MIKNWIKLFLFFFTPIILDQLLKLSTHGIRVEAVVMGWFGFLSNFSEHYSDLPSQLQGMKTIVLFIIGICLIEINVVINLLFSLSKTIRYSISFLSGSLVCFLIDKAVHDGIINNIALTFNSQQFFGFNLSILFTYTSLVVLAFVLIFKPQDILNPKSLRKTFITDHVDQAQFIKSFFSVFTVTYYLLLGVIGIYIYTTISGVEDSKILQRDIIKYFCLLALSLYCFLSPFIFALLVLISNKIYGPVNRFQKYMGLIEQQDAPSFKIRQKDHFKDLEQTAEYIRTRIVRKL